MNKMANDALQAKLSGFQRLALIVGGTVCSVSLGPRFRRISLT